MSKLLWYGLWGFIFVYAQNVEVTSDTMEAFDEKNEIRFIGDANATQGKSWIHADKIVVFLNDQNEIIRYLAKGNATFDITHENGRYTGKAKEVTYHPRKSVYTLQGDALINDISNRRSVQGESIIFHALTGKATVKSHNGKLTKPVRVIFHIDDSHKGKKK